MPTDEQKVGHDSPSATNAKSEAFPKSRRLLKRPQFLKNYQEGKRFPGRCFVAIYRVAPEGGEPRVGLTVSKRVGNAVVRNRAKRLIREAVRKNWDLFPAGCDGAIQARAGVREASLDQIEAELKRSLAKLKTRPG